MHYGNWHWDSNVKITVLRSGLVVKQILTHNVITFGALTAIREALRGVNAANIVIVGVGANADPVDKEDTDLVDERLRVDIILRQDIGVDAILTTAYVAPEKANGFTINEIGWWGGAATTTIGTGTLFSRVLFNHTKNDLESIQIDRLDTFAEAP